MQGDSLLNEPMRHNFWSLPTLEAPALQEKSPWSEACAVQLDSNLHAAPTREKPVQWQGTRTAKNKSIDK